MLDGHLFDTLSDIADRLRSQKAGRPFGGIQVYLLVPLLSLIRIQLLE